jgi:branched-chain amino acid transport system ATP-binding protein
LTTLHGGSIRFRGTELAGMPPYERCRAGLGFVPQEREIFPSLTLEENIAVAARPVPTVPRERGRAGRGRWSIERVYEFFPTLAERRSNRGNELSGGEQQMLAIARALVTNPTLLLMDEPLEGLAPVIVDALLAGLNRLKQEHELGLLVVEQHARLALEFAEAAVILDRGRVVYSGPSRDLLDAPERLASLVGVAR